MATFRVIARLLILTLLATVHALPSGRERKAPTLPLAPSKDSFYTVPEGLSTIKPGTILKNRRPPAPISAFREYAVNIADSYQILYRTTDSFGNATATVLTILVPHNADFGKILSYQVAEDAACAYCAPSYVFQLDSQTGPDDGTSTTQLEILLIEAALEQGWVVIVPDHQGPNSAFLANRLGGYATLDGIRAAIHSAPFTRISKNPTVTLWGYSGGSFVTGWAAEVQPMYAPELKIAGAAVGGTVPNIGNILATVNNTPYSGLIPSGLLGMAAEFPEFAMAIKENISPQNESKFYTTLSQCAGATSALFGSQDIIGIFKKGFFSSNPIVLETLNKNNLGHKTPKIPLFWYKSVRDQVSLIADSDALVNQYCNAGARIRYVRDEWSDHGSLAILGAFRALAWLRDVMGGYIPSAACSKTTVLTSLLDLATIEFLPKFLIDALLDLIGKPIGPLF